LNDASADFSDFHELLWFSLLACSTLAILTLSVANGEESPQMIIKLAQEALEKR